MEVVNPRIAILGYLPILDLSKIDIKKLKIENVDLTTLQKKLEEGIELNPQEVIALSSMMTYKGKNAAEMTINILSKYWLDNEKDAKNEFYKTIKKSIINSAGRGHASLTTSAYVAILMMGNSKFVDSAFTGAIFSSSLMPSGRRTGTGIEDIIIPESINKNEEAKKMYIELLSQQINLYESLQTKGLSKEESAKITAYGIRGGGFMVVPLETILSFKQEFEIQKEFIPSEIQNFISEFESKLNNLGADILYWARYWSARNPYPYPNILKSKSNDKKVSVEEILSSPNPLDYKYIKCENLKKLLDSLALLKKKIIGSEKQITNWKQLLLLRREITRDFNFNIRVVTETFPSWRVWGEVKRHRTLKQTVESVFSSIDRLRKFVESYKKELSEKKDIRRIIYFIQPYYVVPNLVLNSEQMSSAWLQTIVDSINVYDSLINKCNIPQSDALYVIPRGIRLRVCKEYDTFNLIDGYLPLRTCKTAEAEMYDITWKELKLIKGLFENHHELIQHLGPKCHAVGFCLEDVKNYEKCKKVNMINPSYNVQTHEIISKERVDKIERCLE